MNLPTITIEPGVYTVYVEHQPVDDVYGTYYLLPTDGWRAVPAPCPDCKDCDLPALNALGPCRCECHDNDGRVVAAIIPTKPCPECQDRLRINRTEVRVHRTLCPNGHATHEDGLGRVPDTGPLTDIIDEAVREGILAARARQPGVMPAGSVIRDEVTAAVVAALEGKDDG